MRLDPSVWPTKQKCATVGVNKRKLWSDNQTSTYYHLVGFETIDPLAKVSSSELRQLQTVTSVVRQSRSSSSSSPSSTSKSSSSSSSKSSSPSSKSRWGVIADIFQITDQLSKTITQVRQGRVAALHLDKIEFQNGTSLVRCVCLFVYWHRWLTPILRFQCFWKIRN